METEMTNRKHMTLKEIEDSKNPKFHGYVIQTAWNPTTRKVEIVHPEDEVPAKNIITMYWADDRYVTIPED